MKIKVYVDGRKPNSDGSMPVYISVSNNGKRFFVNTGLLAKSKFDGREYPTTEPNYRAKTTALNKKLLAVEEYCLQHENMPMSELKSAIGLLLDRAPKTQAKTFADYVDEFAETKRAESTKVLYRITAKKVREFDGNATFDTITTDWLRRFEAHYLKTMQVNGLAIQMRNLRAVFNWAIDNELTEKYPFRRYKIKQEQAVIRNLSAEQIATLRDYPVEDWQEEYRDMFMLSFYLCGANAGDMLECRSLTNGRFVYHRKKTGRLYNLPVGPEAMAIIEKYRGKSYLLSPLDRYSNYSDYLHHWNDALQKIGTQRKVKDRAGKMRKIEYTPLFPDIRLTTYVARYSFASIAAELDIPRETIALCLGHAWTDVTSHYISYNMRKVDEAVKAVIDYINGIKKDG